ncbi:F-box/LRR-repeat protein At3g26922-like [Gastrolobium bilobum]|uniref:F-box/LRR-repeat protein At3g26922-like n=1 Tax=Gastrolobium bilobum TaxID=150636 RepID=UPI002AB26836|nr:F-box/LRR-repeat protein At3g26922-like [Gastrolobium bilobum]
MMMQNQIRKMKSTIKDNDRLSDLPTAILLHIMSFMKIKDAVQTCILSKRWKDLWKSLPNLTLHTSDFSKPSIFSEFVSGIVLCRDGNHPLHNLDFDRHVSSYDIKKRTRIPKSLNLPTLISLHLEHVAISVDDRGHAEPFSTCNKLNTLIIDHFGVVSPNSYILPKLGILNITNATLANLTINDTSDRKIVISTPNLSSFSLNGSPFQALCGQEGKNVFHRKRLKKLLRVIEKETGAGEKKFIGGNKIGLADLALGWIAHTLVALEDVVGVKLITSDAFPNLHSWVLNFLEFPTTKNNLPPHELAVEYFREKREMFLSMATITRILESGTFKRS